MPARRIHRAHSGTVCGILAENRHQTRGAEIVADQEGSESRNAVSGESGVTQRFRVRGSETAVDGYGTNVSVNVETPIACAPPVNKGKAAVLREFVDICGNSVTFQIGRRGTSHQTMRCQQSRHQPAVVAAPKPDSQVDAFIYQIYKPVIEGDVDGNLRPFADELIHDR